MDDPKETRLLQTKDGIARVPRTQEGVPIKEFLRNLNLPDDLERSVIYQTETGPVAAKPDPVPWGEVHDKMAANFAERLKDQIEGPAGNYKDSLARFSKRLTNETGLQSQETRSIIASKFVELTGKDLYGFLQDVRVAKGLPTRSKEPSQTTVHEPEM